GTLDAPAFTYRWRHPDPRMDALQRAISGLVETAAAVAEAADTTFARIWDVAHHSAETPAPAPPKPLFRRHPPPRLTESWFC
ncbi:MAG: radical SAM protein, partial [Chloroflexota bacterium]|nr:radical SAM protein [Chloroflexota bacterium]